MRIAIRHSTRYRYDAGVAQFVQQLRLTPPSGAGQTVIDWRIEAPGIERGASYTDAFGNQVHLITPKTTGDSITITAEGVVETQDKHGVIGFPKEPMPTKVYLRQTDVTRVSPAIRKLATVVDGGDAIKGFHALMDAIREQVAYRVGTTETHMPASEALAAGEGVCQDHAHIFISAARHLGVPARYVSGYLLLDADTVSDAHHAWAEVMIDPLGWVGFDVTNGLCPTVHHVRLAVGLDSRSAAPIRGIRWGGAEEELDVEVTVEPAPQQQQQQQQQQH